MQDLTDQLSVHFDIQLHQFNVGDYVVALNAIKAIAKQFDEEFLGGHNSVELVIVAEEAGSFKAVFKFLTVGGFVFSGLVTAISLSEGETFRAFYQALTKREYNPAETGETIGIAMRNVAKSFMSLTTDELERCIPPHLNLDKSIHAKSNFYKMCIKNEKIRAVGFDDTDKFPIKRKDFVARLSIDREVPLPSEFLLLKNMVIISPVDVDIDRNWRLRNSFTKREIEAKMRDNEFKARFLRGKYPLKKTRRDDVVTVLVEVIKALKNGEVIQKGMLIKEVYSFNGEIIREIPSHFEDSIPFLIPESRPFDELW